MKQTGQTAPTQPRPAPARKRAVLLVLMLIALLFPRVAAASRPVIVPGREDEILGLLDPHALGDELRPGWTLHSFEIHDSTIDVWIAGPAETYARVALDHPEFGPDGARRIDGFALTIAEQPPGSEASVAELVAAIERNDDGSFWRTDVVYAHETREHPLPIDHGLVRWASDGLLLVGLFSLVLLGLVALQLRGAATWMRWSLLAIVVVGALLRLGLSPEAPLGVWSYTRIPLSAMLIYEGPLLALVHPQQVWMSELILDSNLYFSLLAPLAAYVHARVLLDDQRAALVVAGILACLPLHLRFSHTDAAFIPSITVSSLVFTLIYVATREPNRALGWLAVVAIGAPLALVYHMRPLNIMYCPLLLATVFVERGIHGDKRPVAKGRTAAVFVVIAAVTVLGAYWLLRSNSDKVGEGLTLHTLVSAARVMLNPGWNMLLNPVFTPPGLTLLAGLGAVDLWRRGNRGLFWFLIAWLLGFLVAHAYFVPMSKYMQARYHLHLIVPFMLLAACGVEAALRWLARNREQHAWLAGRRDQAIIAAMLAYVLASPLIHLHAVRHVDFNEVHEWRFVHSLRDTIPPQCTIIEYVGIGADSRFDRVGSYVEAGIQHTSWTVLEIPLPGIDADVELTEFEMPADVRAMLDEPPACLYWYDGLPCVAFKPPNQPTAYACQAIEGFVRLEQVAATSHASHPYDESLGVGLGDRETIDLRLFRAHRRNQ